jgi:hypothetical protein
MQHPEMTRALAGEQLRGLMRSAHAYRQAASAHDARRRGRIPSAVSRHRSTPRRPMPHSVAVRADV